jgi:molybdopterin-guanine dinucleotide biosynthesis protein B
MSIPMIIFVGRSGAGKTTLLVKLIAELRRRGYHLATVKHHSHGGLEIDRPGKDSWRHARAGSEQVIVAAPDKVASYRRQDRELALGEIVAGVSGVDIILIEGYKQERLPTFEVVRAANSLELVGCPEFRFAVAADVPRPAGADGPPGGIGQRAAGLDAVRPRSIGRQWGGAGVSSDKDEKPPARDGPDGGRRDDPGGQGAHFGGENDARAGPGQVQCSLAKK